MNCVRNGRRMPRTVRAMSGIDPVGTSLSSKYACNVAADLLRNSMSEPGVYKAVLAMDGSPGADSTDTMESGWSRLRTRIGK